ncbi:MAG: hypothetical protein ACREWG_00670 [Gammaproteobacteria bacterium]
MKRLVIDRLDLDLRGVSPATAQTVARLLGPALARAMRGRQIDAAPDHQIDAGRLGVATGTEPGVLATRIAERIAHRTTSRA